MNILNEIIENKKLRIEEARKRISVNELTGTDLFNREAVSLKQSILNGSGIIAEFKRRSPSFGDFPENSLEQTVRTYDHNGVSGISVLTDENYFGGSCLDLAAARELTNLPILRKDFIIDEYQLFEAKAFGADAILLIAGVLDHYYAEQLALMAKSIGLEVLMEFHSEEELSKFNSNVDVAGVNNRNLDTLDTCIETSYRLFSSLPNEVVKISESGIRSRREMKKLRKVGYDGFLIGESFLKKQRSRKNLLTTK